VSEGLRAANKALTDKIKAALDGPSYGRFREDSSAFMQGKLKAGGCCMQFRQHKPMAVSTCPVHMLVTC
jgi:hypothetical protein